MYWTLTIINMCAFYADYVTCESTYMCMRSMQATSCIYISTYIHFVDACVHIWTHEPYIYTKRNPIILLKPRQNRRVGSFVPAYAAALKSAVKTPLSCVRSRWKQCDEPPKRFWSRESLFQKRVKTASCVRGLTVPCTNIAGIAPHIYVFLNVDFLSMYFHIVIHRDRKKGCCTPIKLYTVETCMLFVD